MSKSNHLKIDISIYKCFFGADETFNTDKYSNGRTSTRHILELYNTQPCVSIKIVNFYNKLATIQLCKNKNIKYTILSASVSILGAEQFVPPHSVPFSPAYPLYAAAKIDLFPPEQECLL